MKKILFLMSLSIITFTTRAQAPALQWQKTYGGTNAETATAIQQTTDGGFIVAGYSASSDGDVASNQGSDDAFVLKLNATGVVQWQTSLGGSDTEYIMNIQQTADGGYILVGQTYSNDGAITVNQGMSDAWIVKLDATGNLQWEKSIGGTGVDMANYIQQTADGNYIVACTTSSIDGDVTGNHGQYDLWVVKLGVTGSILWQKTFGGTSFDTSSSIQQTADGGYIVSGITGSTNGDVIGNHGSSDYWVVKLTATGTLQWQKALGGSSSEAAGNIQQTADGGYIVTGHSTSNDGNVTGSHGASDGWVVKLDTVGVIEWQKSIGGSSYDYTFSIQQTTDDGYIICGHSFSSDGDVTSNQGINDFWIVKLATTGAVQWHKSLGGTGFDEAFSIKQTIDGGYIAAGSTQSNNGDVTGFKGFADYWVVKLEAEIVIPAPLASAQSFCNGSTVSDLVATGSNLQWYTTSSGGAPLISSTLLLSGTYYVSQTVNGVESSRTAAVVTVNPNITPTFTPVSSICSGQTLTSLPTTSINGVTGTWSPALNNRATTTYTFTPAAGQCATVTTLTFVVNPFIVPTFTAVAPICFGGSLSPLPTTSLNGITGTWSPALDNSVTTTYMFTPTAGQCAKKAMLTITVNPNSTPTFTAVSPICAGKFLAPLPTTSNNGVHGTWSPALNNTATTTYTFLPNPGQCAFQTTMTISVLPTTVGGAVTGGTTVCKNATSGLLTLSGHNGIILRWESSTDNFATITTIANTSSTYTSGPLARTTKFRAVIQGCSSALSTSATVTVSAFCTSLRAAVNEFPSKNETKVYPNPTSGNFTLDLASPNEGVAKIEICSISGAVLKTNEAIPLQEGLNRIDENISDLANGVYLIRVINSDTNEIVIKRLVKQ